MDTDLYPSSFWVVKRSPSEDATYFSHDAVIVVLIYENKVYYTKQLGFVGLGVINGTMNFSYIYRLNEKTFLTKFRPFEGLTFWDYSVIGSANNIEYSEYKAGQLLIEMNGAMIEINFLKQLQTGVDI